MAAEGRRGRVRPGRRLAVLLGTLVVALGLLEVGIVAFVPGHKFHDRLKDCYWILRLEDRAGRDGQRLIRNVDRDDRLGWTMKPSFEDGVEVTNSRGLRANREITYERAGERRRVLLLGDSFTYGLGVANDETYGAVLERETGVEVLNLGVNGYGTDQQLLYWEAEGIRYAPDVVVLGLYLPDFHRNGLSVRELPKPRFRLVEGELELGPLPVPGPREILSSAPGCRSPLRLLDVAGYVGRMLAGSEPAADFDAKARLLGAILARLEGSVLSSGARLVVLVIPDRAFGDYRDHRRLEAVARAETERLGILCLDLTAPLEERVGAGEPLYDPEHRHWTPRGHALAAELLAAFLREQALL